MSNKIEEIHLRVTYEDTSLDTILIKNELESLLIPHFSKQTLQSLSTHILSNSFNSLQSFYHQHSIDQRFHSSLN